jgi:hypothetical protein
MTYEATDMAAGKEDVTCLNPMSNFMGHIAVPKELAFKAIVLGEFPRFSWVEASK